MTALKHCGITLQVNFLDLLNVAPGYQYPKKGNSEAVTVWHDKQDRLEEELWRVADVSTVCLNHVCWIDCIPEVGAETLDLEQYAQERRAEIQAIINSVYAD